MNFTQSDGGAGQSSHPVVSVVIPTWNRADLVLEAIESVLSQTGVPVEVVVVDDVSTDGTVARLRALGDARLRVFSLEEKRERSATRNYGLARVRGEFVLFLDDDDRLLPGALATLLDRFRVHPSAVAAVGRAMMFEEDGQRALRLDPTHRFLRSPSVELMTGWIAGVPQVLIRADEVRGCGGWPEGLSVAEDQDLWLRLALRGPFAFTGEPVVAWRMHAGQWRPKDFVAVERALRHNHIETQLRGRAAAAAHSHLLAWEALQKHRVAWGKGRVFDDLRAQAGALRSAPSLWWSPLTRRVRWRRLLGAVAACLLGSRRARRLRESRAEARRAEGRAPGEHHKMRIIDKSGRRDG